MAYKSKILNDVASKAEIKISGVSACLAVWEKNPEAIIKAYVSEKQKHLFSKVLKDLAKRKLAYRYVEEIDLEKLTGGMHHQGVCFLVRDHYYLDFSSLIREVGRQKRECIVFLDSVSNPHNLGSIIRTAAHFGIKYILGSHDLPKASSSIARIASGGLEFVKIISVFDSLEALNSLKKEGFKLVSTDAKSGSDLFKTTLPDKIVLMFGSESGGISEKISTISDFNIRIPGTESVESLNVGVASALLMAEFVRS